MFNSRVQSQPFDPEQEQRGLRESSPKAGALVSFVGVLRDWNEGEAVREMWLEHYPSMTEQVLSDLLEQARLRWPLHSGRIVHRVGRLQPEDPIVLVAVASAHRTDAFQACEFLIDALKTRAPLWKRESTVSGQRWVAARDQDERTAARWSQPAASESDDISAVGLG